MQPENTASFEYHPLTSDRWSDFENFFGKSGAYGGCWCMWWRLKRSEFENQQGEGNKEAMKAIVSSGEIPGILAYDDGKPVAWCSVAPRENYGSLNRSHVLKPIDEIPVWSIVCFYVAKSHRNKGMTQYLIQSAIDYVRNQGGRVIEAYPTIPKSDQVPPVSSYMGFPAMFEKEGFVECKRPSKSKMMMRYYIH